MRTEECNYFSVRLLECMHLTVVRTDLLAFFCVLHVPSKGSEEFTEACSCRSQQLNLSGSLSIRSRQGLASRQYLGGGRRWTGRQINPRVEAFARGDAVRLCVAFLFLSNANKITTEAFVLCLLLIVLFLQLLEYVYQDFS